MPRKLQAHLIQNLHQTQLLKQALVHHDSCAITYQMIKAACVEMFLGQIMPMGDCMKEYESIFSKLRDIYLFSFAGF